MKRKNNHIKELRSQGIRDWRGYAARARLNNVVNSRETAPIHPERKAEQQRNKDMPAFVAGGGAGCLAHRRAKTFARTMGRAMRRRR